MWVRKLSIGPYGHENLQTAIDLLRGHDQNGVILTVALVNFGNKAFHGGFKVVNALPDGLEFGSTVAVEEWTEMRTAVSNPASMRPEGVAASLSSNFLRRGLSHDDIAFQEHLHGHTLIYQAKSVRIPPRGAIAVNYFARVSSW